MRKTRMPDKDILSRAIAMVIMDGALAFSGEYNNILIKSVTK